MKTRCMYCGYQITDPCSSYDAAYSNFVSCKDVMPDLEGRAPAPYKKGGYTKKEHREFFTTKPDKDMTPNPHVESGDLVNFGGAFWEITGVFLASLSINDIVTMRPAEYIGSPKQGREPMRLPLAAITPAKIYRKVS